MNIEKAIQKAIEDLRVAEAHYTHAIWNIRSIRQSLEDVSTPKPNKKKGLTTERRAEIRARMRADIEMQFEKSQERRWKKSEEKLKAEEEAKKRGLPPPVPTPRKRKIIYQAQMLLFKHDPEKAFKKPPLWILTT